MASSCSGFKTAEVESALILPAPTTRDLSQTLMKKLTGVCVSTIAYSRNLFDESDFKVKSFKGLNVRIIKGESRSNSPGVKCLHNWLQGAFEAMEKKYLKTFSLEIKDATGALLETYDLHYTYEDDQTRLKVETSKTNSGPEASFWDSTQKDIQNLLRNILVATSAQGNLPPASSTSVRIFYYDGTPESYEPPGFRPFTGDITDQAHMSKWTCGKVSTAFHTLSVKTRVAELTHAPANSSELDKPKTHCLCGLEDHSGSLLRCETCGTLQHSACYKIISEEDSQSQRPHKCMKCKGLEPSKDFETVACLFRRVIYLCAKSKSLSIKKLMNELHISPDSAAEHIRRLQREGAVRKSVEPISLEKTDFMHTVDKKAIANLKIKYFNQWK